MCSWLTANQTTSITEDRTIASVPSIKKIQQTLVEIGDKPDSFLNSREWIGALEVRILAPRLCWYIDLLILMVLSFTCLKVFYTIDSLYDVPCRIQHIPSCQELRKFSNIFKSFFEEFGGFAMMGGDIDAASKGVVGIHIAENDAYFLIVVSFPYNNRTSHLT